MALHRRLAAACVCACIVAPSAYATTAPIDTVATLTAPVGAVADNGNGYLRVASPGGHVIFGVSPNGDTSTLAGNGSSGDTADDPAPGGATRVSLNAPEGVAPTSDIDFLLADTGNNEVKLVAGLGITTQTIGYVGPKDVEVFPHPSSLAYLVADTNNGKVWKIVQSPFSATAVAGNGGDINLVPPSDGGSPTGGHIGSPTDVSVRPMPGGGDPDRFYIAAGDTVWKVLLNSGGNTIYRVGTGTDFDNTAVTALRDGGVLVYDGEHGRILRFSSSGDMSVVAGAGVGTSPDGTPADTALFPSEARIATGVEGLLVAQRASGAVRVIPATTLVSKPTGLAGASAAFAMTSWDSSRDYTCRIDGAVQPDCGPYSLPSGTHTFEAAAITDGGRLTDPTPVTVTFDVDSTPPDAFTLHAPAPDATVAASKPDFSWSPTSDPKDSSAPNAGFDHFELWIDGAKAGDLASCAADPCSLAAPNVLSDGAHTWEVRALDKLGNVRSSGVRNLNVASPPTAALEITPSRSLANRMVGFNGGGSKDPNGTIAKYEWDLDGNGSYETDTGGAPTTSRSYDRGATINVSLRVTDNSGLTATTTGTLVITQQAPPGKQLGVSINDGAQFTNDPNVTVFAVWPAGTSDILVSNDGGFKNAQSFPIAETVPWKLESSGPERLPKTVYVRFTGGGLILQNFTDDIILDETPPKVLEATVDPSASPPPAANAAAAKRVTLRVKAKDNVSGVGRIQVTSNKRKPGKLLRYKKKLKVKSAPKLYVRVRDKAGNFSRWRLAKRR